MKNFIILKLRIYLFNFEGSIKYYKVINKWRFFIFGIVFIEECRVYEVRERIR